MKNHEWLEYIALCFLVLAIAHGCSHCDDRELERKIKRAEAKQKGLDI